MWKASGLMPQALRNKPRITAGDMYFYEAFWELSESREEGETFGHIPQSEYVAYFATWLIDTVSERARFLRLVKPLDRLMVSHVRKARQEKMEQSRKMPVGRGGMQPKPA